MDEARRVNKHKQERESKLPAPKNARFSKYKPAMALQEGNGYGDIAMEVDKQDVEEEIIDTVNTT